MRRRQGKFFTGFNNLNLMREIIRKYLIAVYVIIASLAIIAWIFAYHRTQADIWQATWVNISTELLGVVLVFFLVNYIFQLDELDTRQKINELIQKLENKNEVRSDDFFHNQPDMEPYIRDYKNIDIAGVTLTVFVDRGLGSLRTAIANGANVRILLIEKSPEAYKACAMRSETGSTSYYETKHANTIDNLNYLLKYTANLESPQKGKLEIGFLKYPPTIGIERFDTKRTNTSDGKIKVEIYPQHTGWDKPPIFTVDKVKDSEWYKYFENQFNEMWKRSEKYSFDSEKQ